MNKGIFLVVFLVQVIITVEVSSKSLKSHGESCTKRKECNQEQFTICHKGICKCAADTMVYSEVSKSCVIKVGRRCNENISEGNVSTSSPTLSAKCVPNAECKKLRVRQWCRCLEGFTESEDGTECVTQPKINYGEFCKDNSECDKKSGMECHGGSCQCVFAEHQYFDQQQFKCVSFAGGNCSTPHSSPCVKNAECLSVEVRSGSTNEEGVKKIHTKSITQCLCKNGFSKTKKSLCAASYGTECHSYQLCNTDDHLCCVDGKCKCRNALHQIVNEDGKCVNLVGTPCQPSFGPQCVQNSECVDGKCSCREGFTVTPQKTCLVGYKENCEPNNCNKFNGLACIKSSCECFDSFLVYDKQTKACVGLSSSVQ